MKSNGIKFNFVTTYVIGCGGNLSVGAPYSRNCPNITYSVGEIGVEVPQVQLSNDDIKALNDISSINTYNSFTDKYPNLRKAIQAKTLGTEGDKDVQNELASLSPRIVNSGINSTQKEDFYSKIHPLENMALGALRKTFTLNEIDTNINKSIEEVAANKEDAVKFLKKLAENGDVKAMYSYANMLRVGNGVAVNKQEAARFYKMAADNKNSNAALVYAFMLKHGDGISSNKQEAARYFKIAADNGDAKMMIFYANMLKNGDCVPKNEQEAKRYMEMASKKANK